VDVKNILVRVIQQLVTSDKSGLAAVGFCHKKSLNNCPEYSLFIRSKTLFLAVLTSQHE